MQEQGHRPTCGTSLSKSWQSVRINLAARKVTQTRSQDRPAEHGEASQAAGCRSAGLLPEGCLITCQAAAQPSAPSAVTSLAAAGLMPVCSGT